MVFRHYIGNRRPAGKRRLRRGRYNRALVSPAAEGAVDAGLKSAMPPELEPDVESDVDIASLRSDYQRARLDESDVASDPFVQFRRWFDESLRARLPVANAMTLATCDSRGRPSARIVLLKGIDSRGLVFFTNYLSRKGRELAANGQAALLFYWAELERELRVEGCVETVSAAESDDYFASRPLGSRHAAMASPQSEVVANRAELEARFREAAVRGGEAPQRPGHWGGYRLLPECFEFWQGRPSRLHDRLLYTRSDKGWALSRLAP